MCFLFFATCAVELVQLPFPHSQMLVIARPPDFHLDPATVLLARFPRRLSPDSSASPRNGLSRPSPSFLVRGTLKSLQKVEVSTNTPCCQWWHEQWPLPERVKRSWLQLANACWFSPPVVDLFNCAGEIGGCVCSHLFAHAMGTVFLCFELWAKNPMPKAKRHGWLACSLKSYLESWSQLTDIVHRVETTNNHRHHLIMIIARVDYRGHVGTGCTTKHRISKRGSIMSWGLRSRVWALAKQFALWAWSLIALQMGYGGFRLADETWPPKLGRATSKPRRTCSFQPRNVKETILR